MIRLATIKTALQLYDGVTRPLQSMHRAMNIMLNSFEAMQTASSKAVDVAAIQEAREELARAGSTFDAIEENIRQADNQQNRFNNSLRQGSGAANSLLGKLKGVLATVGAMAGTKKALNLSDSLASTTARLKLLVDDGDSIGELESRIMASAQRSRSAYFDTAVAVAKLGLNAGNAFDNDTDQVIAFMEQVNKQFVIGGASAVEQSSAMIQLTQAMAAGALRGEELNSILDAAPGIARAIEKYMGAAEGSIKSYAEKGMVTAEVVKNAMFAMAEETNEKFESMPMTWAQIWSSMQNKALSIFQPILQRINEIGNSGRFAAVADGLINALAGVAAMAAQVFDLLVSGGAWVIDNWSWLTPVLMGVAGAYIILHGAMLAYNTVTAITNMLEGIKAARLAMTTTATGAQTAATFAQTAAQYGLNAALLACPLTWIIIAIIAVVALFYAAVAAVNKFAGTTYSATGIICGVLRSGLALIGNLFVATWNFIMDCSASLADFIAIIANFIGNVFHDPLGAVARLIFDLVDWCIGLLQNLAGVIDSIFGSNLAGAVRGWRDSLGGWVDETFGAGVEVVQRISGKDAHLDRFEYGSAFNLGYKFGEGIEDKVSGLFDFPSMDNMGAGELTWGAIDGIYQNTGDIARNTAQIADDIQMSSEDLELLREIAEREYINKYTTAEIKIEMTNHNSISSEVDVDGVVNLIASQLAEGVATGAEGVHI